MSVKQNRRESADRTIEFRNRSRRRGSRRQDRNGQHTSAGAEEVSEGVKRVRLIILLERWIAARVAEKVAKNAIVKNAVTTTDGGPAVIPRVPGDSYPGLDVGVVVLIK